MARRSISSLLRLLLHRTATATEIARRPTATTPPAPATTVQAHHRSLIPTAAPGDGDGDGDGGGGDDEGGWPVPVTVHAHEVFGAMRCVTTALPVLASKVTHRAVAASSLNPAPGERLSLWKSTRTGSPSAWSAICAPDAASYASSATTGAASAWPRGAAKSAPEPRRKRSKTRSTRRANGAGATRGGTTIPAVSLMMTPSAQRVLLRMRSAEASTTTAPASGRMSGARSTSSFLARRSSSSARSRTAASTAETEMLMEMPWFRAEADAEEWCCEKATRSSEKIKEDDGMIMDIANAVASGDGGGRKPPSEEEPEREMARRPEDGARGGGGLGGTGQSPKEGNSLLYLGCSGSACESLLNYLSKKKNSLSSSVPGKGKKKNPRTPRMDCSRKTKQEVSFVRPLAPHLRTANQSSSQNFSLSKRMVNTDQRIGAVDDRATVSSFLCKKG
ncbi:hypothetical protein BRADI_1g48721v3 [Brachypodium distachyon]|uniref:Uncharacterized protein n=1 Tax=Brachypodium distachyon TaxID=15368 RepID=A0A2K2DQD5_BRADI|nr:hypothetical protein BRADI_1g48721v3 [Brachypodium distachyon]